MTDQEIEYDPEKLRRVVEAAVKHYEKSRSGMVVIFDREKNEFHMSYQYANGKYLGKEIVVYIPYEEIYY